MKAILISIMMALALMPASAADKTQGDLTIAQVLDVTSGLSQLSKYETTDKNGKTVSGHYKFDAKLRYSMALAIDAGRRVQSALQASIMQITMEMSGGTGTIPDSKKGQFQAETAKLLAQPARVSIERIQLSELKLEENPIPAQVLSLLVPIIDNDSK